MNAGMTDLILKRASASRPSGEWNDDDDFDVQADGIVVGRILRVHAAPAGMPWMWTLAFGHHEVPHAHTRLRGNARGGDVIIRQELAAGMKLGHLAFPRASLSNGDASVSQISKRSGNLRPIASRIRRT